MKSKLISAACILLAITTIATAFATTTTTTTDTKNNPIKPQPNPILLKMAQWHFSAFEHELGFFYADNKDYSRGLKWLKQSQHDGFKDKYNAYNMGQCEFNLGYQNFKKEHYSQAIPFFKLSQRDGFDKKDSLYNLKSSYYNLAIYYKNHGNTKKEEHYNKLYRHYLNQYNRLYKNKSI